MTDLVLSPLWTAETLGSPLPDDEFGVSVSLPLWSHVVGYEEGDPAIVSKFRSGYPRFFCPPAISALFVEAEQRHAQPGERCLVFPRVLHAQRCLDFIQAGGFAGGRALAFSEPHALGVAVFPESAYKRARLFWRFCGEVISTRQACAVLGREDIGPQASAAEGAEASRLIRERLAHHAGQSAEDVFLFPSGMAATFAVHRMLLALRPQSRTVQLLFPYVDVLKVQEHFGKGVVFMPVLDEARYAEIGNLAAQEPLAGIFSEVLTNPLLQCVDYARLQAELERAGQRVPLVIDDTIGSSVNVDAFRVADVVTTSLTKTFSGLGDVLAGSVILNRASPFYPAFSAFLREHADHELWPEDAVVLERNSRAYADRVRVMSDNSRALLAMLSAHPHIERVWHSQTDGGPGYAQLRREAGGESCLLSFTLKDKTRTPAFYDALEFCKGPSLGTNFTLASPYVLLAHYEELDWAESCGASRHLIRVSVGIEPTNVLLARFQRALAVV